MTVPAVNGGLQPWNRVIWPGSESNYPLLPTMSPAAARAIPAIGRVLGLISGMVRQMPLDQYAGDRVLPRPRLLEQPDPDAGRSWWVGVQVEDYLLNGNAVHLVTARDNAGWPLSVAWVPAEWVSIIDDGSGRPSYWVGSRELPLGDVIHVRRGADRWLPWRGVGLVEQHLQQLGKVADQDEYERKILRGAAVPSVAVVSPNRELSQETADVAKQAWVEKYGGPVREPAILPAGSQVIPLAWSPHDAELAEAKKLSLTDVANMANLDGYWLGAPSGSFTYKSPGPMYLNLVRQTIAPILEDMEQVWSSAWLPRGRKTRFDRTAVLKDDMQTMVTTLVQAVQAKLLTKSEARVYLGYSEELPEELEEQPMPAAFANPAPDQEQDQEQEEVA